MKHEISNSSTNRLKMDSEEKHNPRTADLSALKIDRQREERIKTRKWTKAIPWILVIAVLVVGYFIALDRLKQGKSVDTTKVRLIKGASAQATLSASGYVVAQRQSNVASKATGRLVFLSVGEGDKVLEGDIIARVESDDVRASLALAEANLDIALADSVDAASNFRRNQQLYNNNLIDEAEFESYQAMYAKANATVQARRASVRSAEISVDNTIIRAPFNGTVINKLAEIGDIVAPMASSASAAGAVVALADMASLEVEADVSEANIQKVSVAQPCEIVLDAYPEVRYTGYVKNIVPTANRASATIMSRIAFNRLDSLIYPEMSARVYFMNPDEKPVEVEEPSYLGLSLNAVMEDDRGSYVFYVEGNTARKKYIETGKTIGRTIEILGGLEDGDEVVLTPPSSLEDGDKIELGE